MSQRRRRILEAARRLVLRQGLRATSMEAIAREAGVAKATLYAYFTDKDAIAGALAAELVAMAESGIDAAFAGEGDAAVRIGNALAARSKAFARLLENSPHAGDLAAADVGTAGSPLHVLEQRLEAAIVDVLTRAGVVRPRPLAQLLLACAEGIARRASISEVGPAMRLMAERLIGPEL